MSDLSKKIPMDIIFFSFLCFFAVFASSPFNLAMAGFSRSFMQIFFGPKSTDIYLGAHGLEITTGFNIFLYSIVWLITIVISRRIKVVYRCGLLILVTVIYILFWLLWSLSMAHAISSFYQK